MSEDSPYEFDTEVTPHAPELYAFSSIAESIEGFDAVDESQIARYHEQGFLAIRHAFTPAEVAAAIRGLRDLVAGKHPDFKTMQFVGEVRDVVDTLSLAEKLANIRKLGTFTEHEPRLKSIAEHPRLLALLTRLLGEGPEMFQSMALIKPPGGREKPWHQDHAYFDLPRATKIVGVWIALEDANTENGCMRIMPGWHRRGPLTHFQLRDWQICDDQMNGLQPQRVAVPLEPGGCLLFDSFLPHGTPTNHTRQGREAVQFHYMPAGTQKCQTEERLAVFGSQGKDVSC
ncbi:MAG: phytanoyl-CoA dioxygenase family protein [Acidobacteriota bacterium]